jgi:hypothetical protein
LNESIVVSNKEKYKAMRVVIWERNKVNIWRNEPGCGNFNQKQSKRGFVGWRTEEFVGSG